MPEDELEVHNQDLLRKCDTFVKGIFILCSQNEKLKTEDGSVSNAAPDICIAYKLHLECGRLINLYDWLEVS